MFRLLYIATILLIAPNTKAGGFSFPNVPFSSTRVFLFNLDKTVSEEPYNPYIYKDSSYANRIHELPVNLTSDFHKKIQTIFKHGIDDLVMGVGKCFLPRHGIVYYNEQMEVVASLSVCFECESIRVWSKKGYNFTSNNDLVNYKKASQQMQQLEKACAKANIPIYKKSNPNPDYITYLEHNP